MAIRQILVFLLFNFNCMQDYRVGSLYPRTERIYIYTLPYLDIISLHAKHKAQSVQQWLRAWLQP